jgi:hypothetical protein
MEPWLLLSYKIPSEPTSRRVYVWRKVKRLGTLHMHDSVWCLPAMDWTREQFQWLAVEISEFGGDAIVFESKTSLSGDGEKLREQFLEQVNGGFRELLEELGGEDLDLHDLSKRFQQLRKKDYFQSELGRKVQQILMEKREERM